MSVILGLGFAFIIIFLLFWDLAILLLITIVTVVIGKNGWGEKGGWIGFGLTSGLAILYAIGMHMYHMSEIKPVCKTHSHFEVYYSPKEWKENTKIEKKDYVDEINIPQKIVFHGKDYYFSEKNMKFYQIKVYENRINFYNFSIRDILVLDTKLKKLLYTQGIVEEYKGVSSGGADFFLSSTLDKILANNLSQNPCGKNIHYLSNYNLPVSF